MDELPPKAAALLRAARRDHDPSRADSERVRVALAAALAAPGHGAQDVQAGRASESALRVSKGASGLFSSTFAKLLVTLGLVGGAALGLRALYGEHTVGETARIPAAAVAPAALPAHAGPQALLGSTARDPRSAREVRGSAREQDRDVQVAGEPARAGETAAPSAPPEVATREVGQPAAALPARSKRVQKSAASPARAGAPEPASAAETEREPDRNDNGELALMRAALGRLNGGDAREALALLDQHAARYPEGVMREERAGLRAIALCKLGDLAQGSAAQQSFLRTYSGSPMTARVQKAGGDNGR
jgi:hypothetical protein